MTSSDSDPVVSVIIPAKDAASYVSDTLYSLKGQFDDPGAFEVIFIDDGSSDDTLSIVQRHASDFADFRVIRNEIARGVSGARNQGIAVSRGRYISLLDADDWFAPLHLQCLVADIKRIGCDFVRTDVIRAQGVDREFSWAPQARRGVALAPRGSIVPADVNTMVDFPLAQAGLYDRRLVDRGLMHFSEELKTAEDRLWTWRLFLGADSYAVVGSPGFVYRRGVPTSLTQALDVSRLDYLAAFGTIRAMVEADAERDRFMPKVIRTVLALTHQHLNSAQMLPEMRDFLVRGARELLSTFPAEEVDSMLAVQSAQRIEALEPVLRSDETVADGEAPADSGDAS